ncbi:carbohydrate ABC transporter permease [Bifidobacterium eulemuris]|uniref:Carbohydrate ABC transporter permease n=1 Tax=Bifidobacterium eulemuris TaxID=1765219 RepID=A0A261G3S9_9BIFI|nr:carbohydrate ABC transporter permease [Bifidobacterium eulemuris]OZG65885.1 sugar ABC transporter permease [Bifidobacterium eulemuris]QOL31957.1 carbohydrate ABC transporter permease [Bifidobacterium eulemuris]
MSSQASVQDRPRSESIPFNPRVRQKKTMSDWIVDGVIAVIVVAIVLVIIYPLWFIVIASFSDPTDVATGNVTLLPKGFSFDAYATILADSRIWTGYANTILYTVVGTVVNLLVTIPAAFACARKEFKPRRVLMLLFTFTMFFGGGLVPSYLLMKQLNLLDSMWVFILPGAFGVYNMIIARSFFESSIPEELRDAARVDGVSYFGFFVKIVLPLSSAIIAVIGLYCFVGHWNDYFTGLIYIRTQDKQPLQVVLQNILLANQTDQGAAGMSAAQSQNLGDQIKFGIILVSTLPLLIIYPFLQKYFNKGVMIGAVKG